MSPKSVVAVLALLAATAAMLAPRADGSAAAGAARVGAAAADVAPLLDGMGAYTRSTGSPSGLAQRYFDQGMVLAWGFNPAEAARSFQAAAAADPGCALCWWGLAWSLGPNINTDMADADRARVVDAIRRAVDAAPSSPPAERGLIAALAIRHPAADRLDEEGYERALRALAARYPADADVQTLAAEALLNLHPYDWWTARGAARPWTPEIERRLERALAADPLHPGANHYAVHLYESSPNPGRGLASAERLERIAPGSGHLMHMPAHIYLRVGRYADAAAVNERAIAADERYVAQVRAQGAYLVGYAAHNHHFLWAAAAMQGRSRVAIDAARAVWRVACGDDGAETLRRARTPAGGTLQHYAALPYYALVRFERWDEILKQTPPPDVDAAYPLAAWHFARGVAFARTGQAPRAREELTAVERLAGDPSMRAVRVKSLAPARDLTRIAAFTLRGEIAMAAGRPGDAVGWFRQATAIEDALPYDEPHLWLAPTRHALGAALLDAGRPAEAERVYLQDLRHYPENGWSLLGLAQALQAQGRDLEARAVGGRFRLAWRDADVVLRRSRH
jgi:tetratricopeptide (TPR) repeat protein